MRNHFMCTHTFSSEEAREKSSDPDTILTDRQFFDKLTGQRARVLQHWRGSEDFFFSIGRQKLNLISMIDWKKLEWLRAWFLWLKKCIAFLPRMILPMSQ